ncbi:RodZ domain-containing protein [Agarivorans sp.]|uniref:RodZ domain-containing protein n=1 Tax=Agarivorans sp. TaxID=1872412 RepID=UPI003D0742F5
MTTKAESEQAELSDDIEVVSPGQMLQEARVAAKLSQNQVAERLKLRLQVVKDIEADSFDSGLSNTFIKGYLRAYARLLNVSEELVLSSYAHLNVAQEQRTEMQSFSRRIKQETHDSRLMKFTYLVVLGIVVLLVVWWWQDKNSQTDYQQMSLSAEQAPAIQSDSGLNQAQTPLAEVTLEEPSAEALTEQSSVVEPSIEPELSSQPEATEPQQLETNPPVAPSETLSQPAAAIPAETADASVTEVQPPEESGESMAFTPLSMSFENECWVEIRDADGQRLVAAIKQPGESLTVTAASPYSIVLGTNAGVSVNYGSEKIDLSSFKRGKVVRMTIPQ